MGPWEWALMQGSHCRLVICRDRLTARGLRRHGVRALAPGNPMMDGFLPSSIPASLTGLRRLLLLPGSRAPEARRNLRRLLKALPPSSEHVLLLACGQQPDDASLRALMEPLGYQETAIPTGSNADAAWNGPGGLLLLGRGRFETWAPWAELGLACAGTATEQLVGLGCPALSLPGQGPHSNAALPNAKAAFRRGREGVPEPRCVGRWGAALAQRATTARRTGADWAPPHGASRRQPGQRPSDSAAPVGLGHSGAVLKD